MEIVSFRGFKVIQYIGKNGYLKLWDNGYSHRAIQYLYNAVKISAHLLMRRHTYAFY